MLGDRSKNGPEPGACPRLHGLLPGRLTLALGLVMGCAEDAAPPVPPVDGAFKIATYNVNYLHFDVEDSLAVIDALDADLVFLQETTPHWQEAIEPRLGGDYPLRHYFHYLPDGGQAVLSRYPLETPTVIWPREGRFPAWCLRVETPRQTLAVLHVHLHPPLDDWGLLSGYVSTPPIREAELAALLPCVAGQGDALMVGDFNEATGPATRLLESRGWRDVQESLGSTQPTWAMSVGPLEVTGRPDHIFVHGDLVPTAVTLVDVASSDHRALVATVGWLAEP